MLNALFVGLGGFIGAVCRYALGGWLYRLVRDPLFPFATLAVNTLGCIVIGFLGGLSESRNLFSPEARLFVFIGILGGFTTFSTFGYETLSLARDGQWIGVAANISGHLLFGLGGVWLGVIISRLI